MKSIKESYDLYVPKLEEAVWNFPWENKTCYGHYLVQTFYYVEHSCKLLEYASKYPNNSKEITECLLHHIAEEKGHEQFAKNDLKHLGYDFNQFKELPETKGLYEEIYRGIDQYGPAPIIGYALALEGVSSSICPKLAPRLSGLYGAKAASFIRLHGELDPGHIQEAFDVVKLFNNQEQGIIAQSIQDSTERYIKFLNTIEHLSINMSTESSVA